MLWYKYSTLFFILFLFPAVVSAEIVISEVYPAPKDGEYEWIELYNPDSTPVATDQYLLKDLTGKPMVMNSSVIEPQSYAIATSAALLNNKDETIFLTKKTGEIIQTLTYSFQFDSEKSYSSCSSLWQISLPTKQAVNSCPTPTLIPTIEPTAVPTIPANPTDTPSEADISGVVINEILPAPETGAKEWIELYNSNDFPVTLTDWFIDSHKFTSSIPAHGYSVMEMTSATFTNTGDTVQLLDPSKKLTDTFTYSYTEKNTTWGRNSANTAEFCLQQPTKNAVNSACVSRTESSTQASSKSTQKSSSPASKTDGSSSTGSAKKAIRLYEGVIPQGQPVKSTDSVDEKEYNITGYKTLSQPALLLLSTYGFYTAISLSLLVFGMILVKMKQYLYEKDSLMALAVVTAICINGYYIYSLFTTQHSSV